jgi:tetratricopeptide (TPR) repeat protein
MGKGIQPHLNRLDSVTAWKLYEKGRKELSKEKPNAKKAERELAQAVKEDPEFGAAWNLLSEARIRMNDLEGARKALQEAIETDPEFPTPCITLALLELKQGNILEAAEASKKAVRLVPENAEAQYYLGIAAADLGNLAKAEESLRRVQGSPEANRFPRKHFLLGNVLAQQGQLPDAASHFRQYLELEPNSRAAVVVRQQLEQWQSSGLIR